MTLNFGQTFFDGSSADEDEKKESGRWRDEALKSDKDALLSQTLLLFFGKKRKPQIDTSGSDEPMPMARTQASNPASSTRMRLVA